MNKGFTLIELLIVITIIAVATGLTAISVSNYNERTATDHSLSADEIEKIQLKASLNNTCFSICVSDTGDRILIPRSNNKATKKLEHLEQYNQRKECIQNEKYQSSVIVCPTVIFEKSNSTIEVDTDEP